MPGGCDKLPRPGNEPALHAKPVLRRHRCLQRRGVACAVRPDRALDAGGAAAHTYPASPTFGLPCPAACSLSNAGYSGDYGRDDRRVIRPLSHRGRRRQRGRSTHRIKTRLRDTGRLSISISSSASAKQEGEIQPFDRAACKHERPVRPRLLPASVCGRGRHACGKPRRFHLK